MEIDDKRYQRMQGFQGLTSPTRPQQIAFAHAIDKMLQMDPFGSHADKRKGAGRGALEGKGESTLKPLAGQIDLPSNHGVKNIGEVTTRNTTLPSTLGKIDVK